LAKNPTATPFERGNNNLTYVLTQISQLTLDTTQANTSEFERQIAALIAQTQQHPEVVKTGAALLTALKADRQTRTNRARDELNALLKTAGEACLAAKVPADLDAALSSLAPYGRTSDYDRRQLDPELGQRGARAYQFVIIWQDYVASLSLNGSRSQQTLNLLQGLANTVDVGLMPRSRILALLQAPEPTLSPSPKDTSTAPETPLGVDNLDEIIIRLEKAQSLEDLIAVSSAMNAVKRIKPSIYKFDSLHRIVNTLIGDRQEVLIGSRPQQLFSQNRGTGQQLETTDSYYNPRVQAAFLAFNRTTQIEGIRLFFDNSSPPPVKANEAVTAYLNRAIEQSVAENNWLLVRDLLDLYRTISPSGYHLPNWLTNDIEGCTAYIVALNLDRAGQHAAAVNSYLRAIRHTGRYVPLEAIGKRIAVLKKAHPEAFTPATTDLATVNRNLGYTTHYGPNDTYPEGFGPSLPQTEGGLRKLPKFAPTAPMNAPSPSESARTQSQ
jgi:hypothetical protein